MSKHFEWIVEVDTTYRYILTYDDIKATFTASYGTQSDNAEYLIFKTTATGGTIILGDLRPGEKVGMQLKIVTAESHSA